MKLKLISTSVDGRSEVCAVVCALGDKLVVRPIGERLLNAKEWTTDQAFHYNWLTVVKADITSVEGEFDMATLPCISQDLTYAFILSNEEAEPTAFKLLRYALNQLILIAERIPNHPSYGSPVSSLVERRDRRGTFQGCDGLSVLAAIIYRTTTQQGFSSSYEFRLNGAGLKLWTDVRILDGGAATIEMTIGSDQVDCYPEFVRKARERLQHLGLTRPNPARIIRRATTSAQPQTVPAMCGVGEG